LPVVSHTEELHDRVHTTHPRGQTEEHLREVLELVHHDKPEVLDVAGLAATISDKPPMAGLQKFYGTPHESVEVFLFVDGQSVEVAGVHGHADRQKELLRLAHGVVSSDDCL